MKSVRAIGVAGNTPRKAAGTTRFVVARGYWATPEVYDVVVAVGGREVAVVGFIDLIQTKGALFWQVPYDEARYYNKDAVLNLARAYARRITGWELVFE